MFVDQDSRTMQVPPSIITYMMAEPSPMLDANTSGNGTSGENVSLDASYLVRIAYLVIGLLGMPGNLIVIFVILKAKKMRETLTNILIVNQSCVDFLASFFIVLTSFIREPPESAGQLARELFCRFWATNLPIWGLFVVSTYSLVLLTYERYFALVHPFKHIKSCNRTRTVLTIPFAWIIGLGFNAAYMIPTAAWKDGKCTVYSEWPSEFTHKAVGIFTVVLQYFVPLGLIAGAYVHIAIVLHKKRIPTGASLPGDQRREEKLMRATRNIVKTLLIVSLTFLMCWTPNQIYYLRYNLGYPVDFNGGFYHFTVIAVFLNCCINPFIYSIKYEQFRKALVRDCRRLGGKQESDSTASTSL